MNFRSSLSLSETGVELPTEKRRCEAGRDSLLVNRLEHLPRACRRARPVLIGNRHYLRVLRAAEMKAWEAGVPFKGG